MIVMVVVLAIVIYFVSDCCDIGNGGDGDGIDVGDGDDCGGGTRSNGSGKRGRRKEGKSRMDKEEQGCKNKRGKKGRK